jgi:FkbH-like protein
MSAEQSRGGSKPLTFLEAQRIVSGFAGGEPLPFLLAMSGTPDPLLLFLRAAGAIKGRQAVVRTLPFNTLGQELLQPGREGETQVFLLFPWDYLPELDWRSGFPSGPVDAEELAGRATAVGAQLARRENARLVYVPAPVPPILSDPKADGALAAQLMSLAVSGGARILGPECFALGSYLGSGCPVAAAALGSVAAAVVEAALPTETSRAKVLVTDLDNVMWSGVVAEDGDQIAFSAEGKGYRHFIYQTCLLKLKREGTLLAAVSRNDADVALQPLRSGRMTLGEQDLVATIASYQAKSAQIRELAARLNLGLDAFVFVDDNPIELAEVAAALPAVRCEPFPLRDQDVPAFFERLAGHFPRAVLTAEDLERTELYRRRVSGMAPSNIGGADLTSFLRDLQMVLTIRDRSNGDRERVVQLINKTNQFNLNGHRVSDEEVGAVLAAGGRLYGATLEDRHGSHGETLACLVNREGTITSFVMSCRVFQRRMEHAFLAWLAGQPNPPSRLQFAPTARNTPFQQFLEDAAFTRGQDGCQLDGETFRDRHAGDLALFDLRAPHVS